MVDRPVRLRQFALQRGDVALQAFELGFLALQERSREVFYASPEEWWESQWSHSARLHLEQVHPQKLEEGRAFATQKMTGFQQVEGIPILFRALFASGRRK